MSGEGIFYKDATLRNLRVLALTSSGLREKKSYVIGPLNAAKASWDWHIDIVCKRPDIEGYQRLAAPTGKIYAEPISFEEVELWESDQKSVANVDAKIREAERATGVPIGRIVLAANSRIGRGFVTPVINLPITPNPHEFSKPITVSLFARYVVCFHWADEILENTTPEIVYSYEWARPWLFVMWLAAQRRGVPCVTVRRSKISSGRLFFTADPMMFNLAARLRTDQLREHNEPSTLGGSILVPFAINRAYWNIFKRSGITKQARLGSPGIGIGFAQSL